MILAQVTGSYGIYYCVIYIAAIAKKKPCNEKSLSDVFTRGRRLIRITGHINESFTVA